MRQAVICLRRSTLKQEQSFDGQRQGIERFAQKNDFTIIKEFSDDGISGAADAEKRIGLMNAVEFIEQSKGAISALIVYDISRLSRDGDLAGYVRYRLRQAGCEILYAVENLPEGDGGDLMRDVLQWEKRQFLKQLARDTIRGSVITARRGFSTGGRASIGYDRYVILQDGSRSVLKDGEQAAKRGKVTLMPGEPEKVALVRRIFEMYVHEGLGFRRIADVLNSKSIPSPGRNGSHTAGRWCSGTVRGILLNPSYIGTACYNRRSLHNLYAIENGTAKELRNKKGRSFNPEDQWIQVQDAHEAIIDKAIFDRAQQIMRQRRESCNGALSRRTGDGRYDYKEQYLLSGRVRCGHCSEKMYGRRAAIHQKGRTIKYTYYVCSDHLRRGRSVCAPHNIDSQLLDAFALDMVKQEALQYENREKLAQKVRERLSGIERTSPNEKKELQSQINVIEQKLMLFTETFSSENLALLKPQMDGLLRKKAELKKRLENCGKQRPQERIEEGVKRALGYIDRLQEAIEKGFVSQLRDVVQAFVHKVTLHFEPVTIRQGAKRITYRLREGTLELNTLTAATENSLLLFNTIPPYCPQKRTRHPSSPVPTPVYC